MTFTPGARRWARLLPIPLLTAVAVTSVATPAEAVVLRSSFAQTSQTSLGGPSENETNSTDITIPDSGPASAYPWPVTFPQASRVTDVDVEVFGFSHTNPDDVELLLVGPGGQQAVLMANAGGGTDISAFSVAFDDEAVAAIPDDTAIDNGGTYRPARYGTLSALPAPAPALNGNTALSVFDGTIAAGTWNLYVFDDASGDVGSISGWTLTVSSDSAPYPSQVAVSGIGTVTDVNVTIDNLTSTYPDDIDLLLVGPQGQQATLMSDVGGSGDVTDVDLTFDDEASTDLPDNLTLTSGAFRPTNIAGEIDLYPAPAPVPTGTTALSAFDGSDPNGAWKLFASDTVGGDFATIAGWSLDIEWNDAAGPTGSVSIAGGAAATKTTEVTLNVSASDPAPGTGVTQMRFSNDGKTFSAYQAYAATTAWSLVAGDGTKTVYAQFKDKVGNESAVVSDAVILDTVGPKAKKYTPKKNSTGVSPKAKVKVFASESLAARSVTKGSVVLKKNGKKIRAKVTYSAAKRLIKLKPKKPLSKGTYKVKVTKKVTDAVGNAWDQKSKPGAQALKWSFKV